ncbi:v-type ATP synthase beta chain [Striga asiatica]|uniref:V-type ATP synthase beta chain n=1 Tax=Striga asiatica TaxID=4170 RepID=A0A5A7R0M9_STRAF|nr:v-type ATP synthase beta chain [Striga asiatica]
MHLKPWLVYSFVAPGLLRSQCNAIARQPQLLAFASAFAISFFAIPFLRKFSRTATFDTHISFAEIDFSNLEIIITADKERILTTAFSNSNKARPFTALRYRESKEHPNKPVESQHEIQRKRIFRKERTTVCLGHFPTIFYPCLTNNDILVEIQCIR